MKVAVVYQLSEIPQYVEFPEPIVQNEDELLITIKAAAIKHFDKGRTSGKHYYAENDRQNAMVIGGNGAGLLTDVTRVFTLGTTGMMAEKAVIDKRMIVNLPQRIDDAVGTELPNAVAGSAMALRSRAVIKSGETVLINGARVFTDKIADVNYKILESQKNNCYR